jgi:hypothetical protein
MSLLFRLSSLCLLPAAFALAQVEFRQGKDAVAVWIDGKPYSNLKYGAHIGKPYLHPLRTASGKAVTRGFPDDPQEGELTGQPHQVGIWTGHEKVNDIDFWETHPTYTRPRKLGRVVFKDVTRMAPGKESGELAFVADWVSPDGAAVVTETERVVFHTSKDGTRAIDVDMTIHPNQRATMSDHTDGIFGIRLGKAFEERNGGKIRNFTGMTGADAIYGQRSPWVTYEGDLEGEKVGVTVMDHPSNFNFPTRWHVRTWGNLNAANFAEAHFYHEPPLRPQPLPKGWRDISVTLEKGEEMRFRYRVLIHPAGMDMDVAWREFARTRAD